MSEDRGRIEAVLLKALIANGAVEKSRIFDAISNIEAGTIADRSFDHTKLQLFRELLDVSYLVDSGILVDVLSLCDQLPLLTGQNTATLLRWLKTGSTDLLFGQFMQWVKLSCFFIGPQELFQLLQAALDDAERFPTLSSLKQPPRFEHPPAEESVSVSDPSFEDSDTAE